ncbi:MAG: hypothetical protein ACXW32_05665 [Limisphaerales bacterium]
MYYWRQQEFEQNAALQKRLASTPELIDYGEYLRLIERGLRKQALKHIEDFLSTACALPIPRQREIASLLCREVSTDSIGNGLLPHPVRARFIDPVIRDWKSAEPQNPEPFRWTGLLDDLFHALQLDPSCEQTRRRLILRMLGSIDFATHELPSAYLGNDINPDLELLRLAIGEAGKIDDREVRLRYLHMIQEEVQLLEDYRKRTHDDRGF